MIKPTVKKESEKLQKLNLSPDEITKVREFLGKKGDGSLKQLGTELK
jgi:hypothetical protein